MYGNGFALPFRPPIADTPGEITACVKPPASLLAPRTGTTAGAGGAVYFYVAAHAGGQLGACCSASRHPNDKSDLLPQMKGTGRTPHPEMTRCPVPRLAARRGSRWT